MRLRSCFATTTAIAGMLLSVASCAPSAETRAESLSSTSEAPVAPAADDGPPQPLAWTFDVRHYDIELAIDHATLTFEGSVVMHATPIDGGLDCLTLHAHRSLDVAESQLLGRDGLAYPLAVARDGDRLTLCSDRSLPAGVEVAVRTVFSGRVNEREHYGLFTVGSDASELPMFFTQLESQGARRVFPVYDEPFDKATTSVAIVADARYTLLSNGVPDGREERDDGTARAVWRNDDPISTYLITVVAAELDRLEGEYTTIDGRLLPLTVYTEPGRADDGAYALEALQQALAYFEEAFGLPYPWDRYGIVAVPGFRYGGMENKGLTNLGARLVYWDESVPQGRRRGIFSVVAHELAHEWFGNLVTMQWWPDIWLNEGFASFMGDRAYESQFDPLADALWELVGMYRWYMEVERGPFAHPIVHDDYTDTEELFDSISYAKGRRVLVMLEALIGAETFAEALRYHVRTHALGNADTSDFFASMQAHTDIDLGPFVDSWLRRAGFPVLTIEPQWDSADGQLTLRIVQASSAGGPGAWVFPLAVGLQGDGFDQTEHLVVDQSELTVSFALPAAPSIISVNRGSAALIDFDVAGVGLEQWALQARQDSDLVNRGYAWFRIVESLAETFPDSPEEFLLPPAAEATLEDLLSHESWALRAFAASRLTDTDLPSDLRVALSRSAVPHLMALLEPAPGDDTLPAIDARNGALVALGYADDPDARERLLEIARGAEIDTVEAAIRGLLLTSHAERFDVHRELLERFMVDQPMRRNLVGVLAATPDPRVLQTLRAYLDDPTIVDPADNQMPRAYLGTLIRANADLAYSQDGMTFLLDALALNLDRPGIVMRTLRGFQDATERDEPDQARLRQMLVSLREVAAEREDAGGVLQAIDQLLESLGDSLTSGVPTEGDGA